MKLRRTRIRADLGKVHLECLIRSPRAIPGIDGELLLSFVPMFVGMRQDLETSLHADLIYD